MNKKSIVLYWDSSSSPTYSKNIYVGFIPSKVTIYCLHSSANTAVCGLRSTLWNYDIVGILPIPATTTVNGIMSPITINLKNYVDGANYDFTAVVLSNNAISGNAIVSVALLFE